VVPSLESWLGWRAPFLSACLVATTAFFFLLACPADAPRAVFAGAGKPRRVLLDPSLLRLGVLYSASFGLSIVVGNWVVTLLERNGNLTLEQAGIVGALTLAVGAATRPLGGWVMRTYPERTRRAVGVSLALGALGTLALTAAEPTLLAAAGALLIGVAAGIPFAPSFLGAAATRPDAPAAAIGYVNGSANLVAVIGTPLLGLTFALPGDGRLGFLVVATLWCAALAFLPSSRELGVAPSP
jgi:nitrate/nitrite transporter NarK